jgi:hypothetical protein
MRRPTYQKKTDRIVNPQATQDEIKCDVALAAFTRACEVIDKRWGINRLPTLVSPETLAKWGTAMAGLYAAEDDKNPDKVAKWAEICIRGLNAMDAEATDAGQPQADPNIWEYEFEGVTYGIIEDGRQWPAAYKKRKDLMMFNMREVAIALDAHRNALVRQVKQSFPSAQITAIRSQPDDNLEDVIEL